MLSLHTKETPNDYDDSDDVASKGHWFNRLYTSRNYVIWFFL